MALFLFRGPPIYAAGQGANANVTASVPAPAAVVTASALAPIVWAPLIPDQIFTQNVTASHNLGGYVSIAGGYPLRLTLAPGSAALPSGITWNETTTSLVGTNPPTVTTVSGVKLRATSGVLLTASAPLAAPSASVAATATQPSPGVFAAITETVPRPAGVVTATATQDPPPVGIGYPTTYTVPSDSEYVWSDTSDWDYYNLTGAYETHPSGASHHTQWQVPGAYYAQVYGHTLPHPGWYMRDDDGGLMWQNVGGDWADLNNLAQGNVTFRAATIPTAAHNVQEWFSWNIYNLVSLWLAGTFRNAGFWMRANNTNTTTWASKWDVVIPARTPYPDRRPYLMLTSTSLGQVRVECTRNIGIISSSESTQAGAVTFQTSGSTQAGLVYFDLSAYSAADITGAVFWCLSIDRFGSQAVNIYRCLNPANHEQDHNAPIDTQHVGLAANYPLDVGIENDPKVYFVQKFTSAAVQPNGAKAFDDLWESSVNSGYVLTTAADATAVANGFTPLAGIYNGGRATCTTSGGPSAYFQTGRGHPTFASGKRLKPYVEVDEMYLRFYVLLGLDWDPAPHPGKFPGFDGRYRNQYQWPGEPAVPTLLGMGRGNSGSGTDGITGWSARGNFSRARTPGSPMENLRGLGFSDSYTADMTNFSGGQYPLTNHMLGMLRKGQWHCVDLHCKMNSVTQPAEQPRRVTAWSRTGTVCTVVLQDPQSLGDPLYQVGAIWSSGGAGAISGVQGPGEWQGPHAITSIIDARTFTYTLAASSAGAPSMGQGAESGTPTGWWVVPGVGNFDGIIEGWINGRKAGGYTGLRFRHSARRPDGGLLGIDGAWFAIFVGGDPAHTYAPVTCYLSNIVVASSYIGPLVGYP